MPTRRRRASIDRTTLIETLDSVYRGPAWHGPSVTGALLGIQPALAAARIRRGRPTIREIVLHLAYSRHLLRSRLLGKRLPPFERRLRKPWWPAVVGGETRLGVDMDLLGDHHERLIADIDSAPKRRLSTVRHRDGLTIADELIGLAIHDGYHAGQIVLLRKLGSGR